MTRRNRTPGGALQHELRDLLCLAVVGDHLRWAVCDDDGELARLLSAAVPRWRALADRVAERLVALETPPDGRVRSLAQDIPLNWVPEGWIPADEARRLLEQRVHALAAWARLRRSQTSDADSADILEAVYDGLEWAG